MVHRITAEEAQYKLGKVRRVEFGKKGIPYCVTHDGRTIRYPDPNIKVRGGLGPAGSAGVGRSGVSGRRPQSGPPVAAAHR